MEVQLKKIRLLTGVVVFGRGVFAEFSEEHLALVPASVWRTISGLFRRIGNLWLVLRRTPIGGRGTDVSFSL
jgi:hypothetical protein